jgi:CDP-glucose 4,6-dehydratase
MHEAGLLKLNCDKALFDLDWHSTLQFDETIKMTVEWYKTYYQNKEQSMYDFTISQIKEYTKLANSRSLAWADND